MTTTTTYPSASGESSGSPAKAFAFYTSAALKDRKDFGRGAIVTGGAAAIVCLAMDKTRGSFDLLLSVFCVGVLVSLCLVTLVGFIRSAEQVARAREKDVRLEQQLRTDFKIAQSVVLPGELEALERYLADNAPELSGQIRV